MDEKRSEAGKIGKGIRLGPAFLSCTRPIMRHVCGEIFVSMDCAAPLGMCGDRIEAGLLMTKTEF